MVTLQRQVCHPSLNGRLAARSTRRPLPRGRIKVSSSGHTVAMKDRRLPTAVQDNNFGAADHGRREGDDKLWLRV
jgi:hypothetical protein